MIIISHLTTAFNTFSHSFCGDDHVKMVILLSLVGTLGRRQSSEEENIWVHEDGGKGKSFKNGQAFLQFVYFCQNNEIYCIKCETHKTKSETEDFST